MWIAPPIQLNELPQEPGVYRMLNAQRKVIYIGKARNLRKRVSSYFQRQPEVPRTFAMVKQIRDIEFSLAASEAEALILEHNLIKQLKPRYNVLLKDSKTYPYLLLTDEHYPKLRLYRGKRELSGEYFGPFPHANAVHQTLHSMEAIFQLRDCDDATFHHRTRPCMQHQIGRCSAPCCDIVSHRDYQQQVEETRLFLQGKNQTILQQWQTNMQQASKNMKFEAAAQWRDKIQALQSILAGNEQSDLPEEADAIVMIRRAESVSISMGIRRAHCNLGTHNIRLKQASDAEDEEILQAFMMEHYQHEQVPKEILLQCDPSLLAELQKLLKLIQASCSSQLKIPKRGKRLQWIKEIQRTGEQQQAGGNKHDQKPAFEALAELLDLPETPHLIAAVDNAHLSGQHTVAAVVYGGWQGPEKKYYRRYQLDETTKNQYVPDSDDYAAMEAVLSRFYRAIVAGKMPKPDVMLIDGGKGQLDIAIQAAQLAGLKDFKQVGVAKGVSRKLGAEVLWSSWCDGPLKPGIHSPALMLIARVRDESHRFAGEYMRKRKKNSMFHSSLDRIEGIGTAKRATLLKHFGGIDGIKRASRTQLAQVSGISEILAARVFTALHQ
ncbi:MAG: excinuclease ABC subunit UvrC [Zetaproteobacteria bacterium]|nr:excinuclease ABC subunit UvrC [Zetaproteobacteria bacterium]